ncbi:hypothetical protein GCM10023187_41450 [Nibrella viscosa]|uniref:DUF5615 domain-containing protein n=2 Tax=Nibrella viscosa TaxID=1084524 RepID=A0ABP8KQI2_9BACT
MENYRGIPDENVLTQASATQAILLTSDKDFGALSFRVRQPNCGIILFRLPGLSSSEKGEIILQALKRYAGELENAFTVITAQKIRIIKYNQ